MNAVIEHRSRRCKRPLDGSLRLDASRRLTRSSGRRFFQPRMHSVAADPSDLDLIYAGIEAGRGRISPREDGFRAFNRSEELIALPGIDGVAIVIRLVEGVLRPECQFTQGRERFSQQFGVSIAVRSLRHVVVPFVNAAGGGARPDNRHCYRTAGVSSGLSKISAFFRPGQQFVDALGRMILGRAFDDVMRADEWLDVRSRAATELSLWSGVTRRLRRSACELLFQPTGGGQDSSPQGAGRSVDGWAWVCGLFSQGAASPAQGARGARPLAGLGISAPCGRRL